LYASEIEKYCTFLLHGLQRNGSLGEAGLVYHITEAVYHVCHIEVFFLSGFIETEF